MSEKNSRNCGAKVPSEAEVLRRMLNTPPQPKPAPKPAPAKMPTTK